MNKRITALIFGAILLAGSMTACSNGSSSNESGNGNSQTQTAANELTAKMQDLSDAIARVTKEEAAQAARALRLDTIYELQGVQA